MNIKLYLKPLRLFKIAAITFTSSIGLAVFDLYSSLREVPAWLKYWINGD